LAEPNYEADNMSTGTTTRNSCRNGFLFLVCFALLFCTHSAETQAPQVNYRVKLASLSERTLQISMTVSSLDRDTLTLRGVPAYIDNPTGRARSEAVRNLVARDSSDRPLPVRKTTSPEKEPLFLIDGVKNGVSIAYDLFIDFENSEQTTRYPTRIPFMDSERAWLCGNYLFCFPELDDTKAASVGHRLKIAVNFDLPAEVPLVGVPTQMRFNNAYQLMSLQFGLGEYLTEETQVQKQPLILIFQDAADFRSEERAALRRYATQTLAYLSEFFGGFPFPSSAILFFRTPGERSMGGLEGSFACQVYLPEKLDLADESHSIIGDFRALLLHELFHSWNPISLYAMEDPWIKEGFTSYYDKVLSYRLGFLDRNQAERHFRYYFRQLEQNPLMRTVPLTDPRIWNHEYDGEEWRTLTYERGKAVALLLDVFIRRESRNRHHLDQVMRALFARYRDKSFSHRDLLEAIRETTGVSVEEFFARYVAGLEAPPPEAIREALAEAERFGVFKRAGSR
jgi:predicted metalloprotease with PDZ domain